MQWQMPDTAAIEKSHERAGKRIFFFTRRYLVETQ
jgi:hypothetical protein